MKYFDWNDVLASFKWMWRDERDELEKAFASYIGAKYAIGTSFGRTALYLALKTIDVEKKEIILPTFLCTVVKHAVIMAKGIPCFVDVRVEDFGYDLNSLKNKLTKKTKAIVLIHYFGRVAKNIDQVIEIARENNLILIEDCAHSLGAVHKGKKTGTFGNLSIFSLTKGMINFGGGVMVTNDHSMYKSARKFIQGEKVSMKKRIVDLPITIEYGLEQIIDKVLLNRVKKYTFKWRLINLPKMLLTLRHSIIKLIKFFIPPSKILKTNYAKHTCSNKSFSPMKYEQGIHMEPIIASLAKTQLKKVDSFIEMRKKILHRFDYLKNNHFKDIKENVGNDVCTYLILRFPEGNICKVIDKCKRHGLLLRETWPVHQRLLEEQETKNVRRIEKEILSWHVTPMLSSIEIDKFTEILNNC